VEQSSFSFFVSGTINARSLKYYLRGDFSGLETHRSAPSGITLVPGKIKMFACKAIDFFVTSYHNLMLPYFYIFKNTDFYYFTFNQLWGDTLQCTENIVSFEAYVII